MQSPDLAARVDTLIKLMGACGASAGELLDGMGWDPGGTRLGEFEFQTADEADLGPDGAQH